MLPDNFAEAAHMKKHTVAELLMLHHPSCPATKQSCACRRHNSMQNRCNCGFPAFLAVVLLAGTSWAATKCPAGQAWDGSFCLECSGGEFQTVDANGDNVCNKCPFNTFSNTGATSCTKCPPGQLTRYEGSSSCESCWLGTVPGFEPDGTSPTCVDCPAGEYTPTADTGTCQQCKAGSYISMGTDTWDCILCPAGSAPKNKTTPQKCYADSFQYSCCELCQPGSFNKVPGTLECQLCPAGTYQPKENATACIPCPAGTYSDQPGSLECVPAPIGTYQDKTGQTSAVPCPSGTVGLVKNGTSEASSCFPYKTGRYGFTERQDRISVLTIRSFGTNAAVQSLGTDQPRVMDSGSATGCGGEVYSLETYYMCSRYPLVEGVLDKSVCTSQPTSGPLSSSCLSYSFYALSNNSYAWVIDANNTGTSTCLLNAGEDKVSCRFVEQVGSTTYLGEYLYFGNIQQADGQIITNTAPNTAAAKTAGRNSASHVIPTLRVLSFFIFSALLMPYIW